MAHGGFELEAASGGLGFWGTFVCSGCFLPLHINNGSSAAHEPVAAWSLSLWKLTPSLCCLVVSRQRDIVAPFARKKPVPLHMLSDINVNFQPGSMTLVGSYERHQSPHTHSHAHTHHPHACTPQHTHPRPPIQPDATPPPPTPHPLLSAHAPTHVAV